MILTGAIRRQRKGAAISGSPPLTELFRRQTEQATQDKASEAGQQGLQGQLAPGESEDASGQAKASKPPASYRTSPSPDGPHGRPTPRRLHFPTALDEPAQLEQAPMPVEQTTPARTEEPAAEVYMHGDYF